MYEYAQKQIYGTQIFINYIKKIIFKQYFKFFPCSLKMVDIGGGNFVRFGWKNLDYYSGHYGYKSIFVDINHNLFGKKELPFKSNSVDLFYSSHTFEHIPNIYCQHIFNEIYRSLKNNGIVRITLPDFDLYYKSYGRNDKNFYRNFPYREIHKNFLKAFATAKISDVSIKELKKNFKKLSQEEFANFYTNTIDLSTQTMNPSNHINWWTYEKMEKLLIKAGFNKNNIYRSLPQQSLSPHMRGTGNNGFDIRHTKISLFVEAIK